MNAYFFHTAAEPLFGVYAPPAARADRDEAILICPPVAHEYTRCHWALRQLAERLALEGFHVFRFDYTGLGDSWGEFGQASVARWVDDVRTALAELADTAGVRQVTLLGLRLGATLALEAARGANVARLVLWDPVVRGSSFVAMLRAGANGPPNAPHEDLAGFRYPTPLLAEIGALDLMTATPPAFPATVVSTATRPEYDEVAKRLRAAHVTAGGVDDWERADRFSEPLVVGPVQRLLVEHLTGGRP